MAYCGELGCWNQIPCDKHAVGQLPVVTASPTISEHKVQNNHHNSQVLIVGAGAMGLVGGYHLQLAGAEVTFLVRPNRIEDLKRPQILYSYDDATLKQYSGYAVISRPKGTYDYVVLTIDGAALRSAEGTALLKELGDTIRDSSAIVIVGGVGLDLRDWVVAALKLPDDRVVNGLLGNLAYQVARVSLPVHPPTDPTELAKADIGYRHFNPFGFLIEDRYPTVASQFAKLYDRCGVSKCNIMNSLALDIFALTIFPVLAGSELMGWPRAAEISKDKETWALTVAAAREIASVRLGDKVDEAGLGLTSEDKILEFVTTSERDSMPLDIRAFHAFHHGNKVAAQDLKLMKDAIAAGARQGRHLTSLQELVARLEAQRNS